MDYTNHPLMKEKGNENAVIFALGAEWAPHNTVYGFLLRPMGAQKDQMHR
jgi:hypothetical protein